MNDEVRGDPSKPRTHGPAKGAWVGGYVPSPSEKKADADKRARDAASQDAVDVPVPDTASQGPSEAPVSDNAIQGSAQEPVPDDAIQEPEEEPDMDTAVHEPDDAPVGLIVDLDDQALDLTEEPDESAPASWQPAPQDPSPTPRAPAWITNVPLLARFQRFANQRTSHGDLTVIEQLRQGLPTDRLMGWVVTVVITAFAFLLRIFHLGQPNEIMFDEVYYAKDAWSLLQYGYEGTWVGDSSAVSQQVAQGDYSALTPTGEWAVHPEIGKWLIAFGERLFGLNAFGWRFSALVFGCLLIFVTIRLARRLSRSTLIGGLAGVLLAVDGLSFVMSRIALLDIFQAFFIVAAVSCVVADRDYFRHKLADHLESLPGQTLAGQAGPFIFRPWLLAAGLMFGLACGTKWNSMYVLATFGILVVVWSITTRRLIGAGRRQWISIVKDGVQAFVSMAVVTVVVYMLSWIPWLKTATSHDWAWGSVNPDSWVTKHFGQALGTLWQWHIVTYQFHSGSGMASATHTYSSDPWQWTVLARTIGIYAQNGIQPGEQGCTAPAGDTCLRVVTGLGTPLLWWGGVIALIAALIWWLAGKDWRFGVVILGYCSTWIPWMFIGTRPEFVFYAITMVPFMAIAVAMGLGVILGPVNGGSRRRTGAIIVAVFVALVFLNFAFNYPIYTAGLLTRQQWDWRMWLPGWI